MVGFILTLLAPSIIYSEVRDSYRRKKANRELRYKLYTQRKAILKAQPQEKLSFKEAVSKIVTSLIGILVVILMSILISSII